MEPLRRIIHPLYCPNPKCPMHARKSGDAIFYKSHGWTKPSKCRGLQFRRYKCKFCQKTFILNAFRLAYREKRPSISNAKIFALFTTGASLMTIARQLGCSEHLVRGRCRKLHQQGLLRHAEVLQGIVSETAVVMDGLENFAYSQYNPNNVNQLLGKDSLFIYDWNYSPMNRKGRMSNRQRWINEDLESQEGRYDPQAIRFGVARLLKRACGRLPKGMPLVLFSDNHYLYRRAIARDLKAHPIHHHITPSTDTRCYRNNLFPINHSDLLTRQHIGAYRRETIAFAKSAEAMVERFGIFTIWKNYARPLFVKKHKMDELAHIESPAMRVGAAHRIWNFEDIYDYRRTPYQIKLSPDFSSFFAYAIPEKRS